MTEPPTPRPGPIGTPQQSLLARFLELAAHQLGGQLGAPESTARAAAPSNDPGSAASREITFQDWSEYTRVEQVTVVTPDGADDVVALCRQAAAKSLKVRALGHAHNWSPLVVPPTTPPRPKVVLVDTSKLDHMSAAVVDGQLRATFGAGTTLEAATAFLQKLDNQGASEAPGYSFLNMPTPGRLTLGGILAVGGHGTSVPWTEPEPDLMGCLSNLIVSFKAVVTDPDGADPDAYELREFQRSDPDAAAFLVHLGRAFVTEVTLAPVPNYYLQLTNLFPSMDDLMAAPSTAPLPEAALASLLDAHGRVEVIWFPNPSLRTAWVQCNTRQATKTGTQVPGPYNYGWMNGISRVESLEARIALSLAPQLTPTALAVALADAQVNMTDKVLNGTARDLEIYLTDDTLRMSICGYVLQLPRAEVQAAAHEFDVELQRLLTDYESQGRYPINGAVEIRCTTIDRQTDLHVDGARPPALAATHSVDADDPTLDTVLWVDVLTFPDTDGSSQFFVELETWMIEHWGARHPGRLRPEWSKGWAYTDAGPWTNTSLIEEWIPSVYNRATDGLTFDWAKQTLAAYDRAGLFTNDFLDRLFS